MPPRAAEEPVIAWLLEPQEPAIRYLASRDLLRKRPSSRRLRGLRDAIPLRGWAADILSRQREGAWWERKDTTYWPRVRGSYWSLSVLGDLGLSREDPCIADAVEHMLRIHLAPDGGFSPLGRPKPSHFCSTGIMVRTLLQLGYVDDPRTWCGVEWLVAAQLPDGGWECRPSREGTLDAWEAMAAFAAIPEAKRSRAVRDSIVRGAEFYLSRGLLHEGARYPRWSELHYPWHYWYDALVGLDFLAALGYGAEARLEEALHLLRAKRLPGGRWRLDGTNGDLRLETPGRPSKMITFLALRVLQRVDSAQRSDSSR